MCHQHDPIIELHEQIMKETEAARREELERRLYHLKLYRSHVAQMP